MSKEILTFGLIEIEKNKFYHHKSRIYLKNTVIEKSRNLSPRFFLVKKKVSFGGLSDNSNEE